MNWKTTVALLVVALGVGAFLYFGYPSMKGTDEAHKHEDALVAEDDLKEITRFELKTDQEEMVCEKQMQGTVEQWMFVKPARVPAARMAVQDLLQVARRMQHQGALPPERKPSDKVTGLNQPSLVLTLATPARTFVIRFGKPELPQENEVWAAKEGDPLVYLVPKDTFTGLHKKFKDLRDKALATYEPWKVDRLVMSKKMFRGGGEEYYEEFELSNKGAGWTFVRPMGEAADEAVISRFLSDLNSISIEDFIPKPEKLDEFGLEKPDLKVQVFERGMDRPVEIYFGKRIKDDPTRMAVMNPVHGDLGIVDAGRYDRLKKRPEDFRSRVIFTCREDQIKKVLITLPWKEVELVREEREMEREVEKEGKKEKVKEKVRIWILKRPEGVPAVPERCDIFVRTLLAMRIGDFVDQEAVNLSQYYLDQPVCTATLVCSKPEGGEESRTITIGVLPNGSRAYMLRSSDAKKEVYEMPLDHVEILKQADLNLLDPIVFSVDKNRIAAFSVQFDEKGPFSRSGRYGCEKDPSGKWQWSESSRASMQGLELDPGRVEQILQRLSRLVVTQYISDRREAVAEHRLDRPEVTLTVRLERDEGGSKIVQEKSLVISPKVGYNTMAKFVDSPIIFSLDPFMADTLKEGVHQRGPSPQGHDGH